jgi:hypothetical protein
MSCSKPHSYLVAVNSTDPVACSNISYVVFDLGHAQTSVIVFVVYD